MFIRFICTFLVVATVASGLEFKSNQYYSVVCQGHACTLVEGKSMPNSHAYGMFADDVAIDGWGKLWVHSDNSSTGWYEGGFLEGSLTSLRIYQHFQSWYSYSFPTGANTGTEAFILDQYEYAKAMVSKNKRKEYYDRLGDVLNQFEGVLAGSNYAALGNQTLSKLDLLFLQAAGDLYDIIPATTPSLFKLKIGELSLNDFVDEWHRVVSCSALIKISDDLSDAFLGHTTWTSYTGMLRIFKNYNMNGGQYQVSFSAKPGSIYSKDDFYVLPRPDQQLVVIETTNGNMNPDLYKLVVPTSLLTWQRIPMVNSLATSGKQWTDMFSKHQSGTYCNQYMIADMKHFTPGRGADSKDFLWIIEVLPGTFRSSDVSSVVLSQGNYWPSYNIPYDRDIYNISGYQNAYNTYGDSYSYQNSARAQMMRRDQGSVQSLAALGDEMRRNDYTTDPLAAGDPYVAISSRKDLRTTSPSLTGGIDSKITSYTRVTRAVADGMTHGHGLSRAQSGPSHQNKDLPPFSWSASQSTQIHLGQPDTFDFDFVEMDYFLH